MDTNLVLRRYTPEKPCDRCGQPITRKTEEYNFFMEIKSLTGVKVVLCHDCENKEHRLIAAIGEIGR